jgi:adenylosuccinate synthase
VLSYSVTIGGINEIALMHLDTIAGLKELKVCKGYRIGGKETSFFPANIDRLAQAECIYEILGGWSEDISQVTDFNQLPENARKYVLAVEELAKSPITMVGVGPRRDQVIYR